MKLEYINKNFKKNIDINQLRPNKSYDHLMLNRNGHLSNLIQDKEASKQFLHLRTCPCCKSALYNFKFEKGNRYIQICPPNIGLPMKVVIVDSFSMLGKKNNRNNGGFGSTGI